MICTYNDALSNCDRYRDTDRFCTRNCSCSGLSYCNLQPVLDSAREEADAAGVKSYDVLNGKCGDWYVVPRG